MGSLMTGNEIGVEESESESKSKEAILYVNGVRRVLPDGLAHLTLLEYLRALQGQAALKARLPKEAKKSATISPYEKGVVDPHSVDFLQNEIEENLPCVGDLLQITQKGCSFTVNSTMENELNHPSIQESLFDLQNSTTHSPAARQSPLVSNLCEELRLCQAFVSDLAATDNSITV